MPLQTNLPPDYDDVTLPIPYDLPPINEPSSADSDGGPPPPGFFASSFAPPSTSTTASTSTPAPAPAPAPTPASPSLPPPLYTGPLQFVFTSPDVLSSSVIQAHSARTVYVIESSANGSLTAIKGEDGRPRMDIIWSHDAEPQLNFDFKGRTVPLKKFMYRSRTSGVLFNVQHRETIYEVYQAGPALGLRLQGRKEMLAGIRDPYKHVEVVISPEGMEADVLPLAVACAVLLKSKKSLGKEFEERQVRDKVWKGIDYMFRSIGRDSVAGVGPSGGVGKDRR